MLLIEAQFQNVQIHDSARSVVSYEWASIERVSMTDLVEKLKAYIRPMLDFISPQHNDAELSAECLDNMAWRTTPVEGAGLLVNCDGTPHTERDLSYPFRVPEAALMLGDIRVRWYKQFNRWVIRWRLVHLMNNQVSWVPSDSSDVDQVNIANFFHISDAESGQQLVVANPTPNIRMDMEEDEEAEEWLCSVCLVNEPCVLFMPSTK